MEMKKGYKQTEVGVIPEDWMLLPLRNLLNEPPKYGINAAAVTLEGILPQYIRITDISEDGYFKPTTRVGVNHLLSENYIVKDGDLLLARTGASVGKSYLYRKKDGKLVYAGFLIKISPNNRLLDSQYLYQYLNTFSYWNWVKVMSVRSGQPGINGNEYGLLNVPLPPTKTEQTAIANALSDADALIQSLSDLIAKKRQIKQGTMQTLLNPYKKGRLKAGWVEKKLGDVLKVSHGKRQHEVIDENGDYPILASGGILGRANTYLYNKPSVLIGRKGTIDVPQYMDKPFWVIDTLFYTEVFEPNNAKYLFYQFNLIDWYAYNAASGVPSLSAKTIENIDIATPSPEEQSSIATSLSDMDTDITALETKLAKVQQIKKGMMQNLLTGRIRLVKDEAKTRENT